MEQLRENTLNSRKNHKAEEVKINTKMILNPNL